MCEHNNLCLSQTVHRRAFVVEMGAAFQIDGRVMEMMTVAIHRMKTTAEVLLDNRFTPTKDLTLSQTHTHTHTHAHTQTYTLTHMYLYVCTKWKLTMPCRT